MMFIYTGSNWRGVGGQCCRSYFESIALQATNYFTLEEVELQQSYPRVKSSFGSKAKYNVHPSDTCLPETPGGGITPSRITQFAR